MSRGIIVIIATAAIVRFIAPAAAQDTRVQMRDAAASLEPVTELAHAMLVEGRLSEANAKILAVFPEPGRTPVQALMLGNVLYKHDPASSYQLHRKAATALADEASAHLEWAMEQHRAGEYAGALKTYRRFSELEKEFAPAYGLAAECALRTGDVVGAIELWKKSETARSGSLDTFEELACEVNGDVGRNEAQRESLLKKANAGDAAAAEQLLLMDADWEFDWWNRRAHRDYLPHDLAAVRGLACAGDVRVKAAILAAECSMKATDDEGADADSKRGVAAILKQQGYLLDKGLTLPENGKALSLMLGWAIDQGGLDAKNARSQFGDRILATAGRTKDPEAFNAAAHLYLETPRLLEIDRAGWAATHDARFAGSLLAGMLERNELKTDSPELLDAIKRCPENAEVAWAAVTIAAAEGKPLEPYLVAAIKAEYRRFSPGGLLPRPKASMLRSYFKALEQVHQGNAPKLPPRPPTAA